ncbi:Hypothetical protein GLP15_2475 [Giardia lamblia P15]|uniref:Uncharacterized protein n=1 Tax=Giardia intestinalis (strain P15) TaxID=658858 RepID=E1F8R4_GIAIA|nr:Hypothetical protein GLP15_2475 [Giardia lamblia P15]
MSVQDILAPFTEACGAKGSSATFVLLGNGDAYKGALATRLLGKQVIIPPGTSKYTTLLVSSDRDADGAVPVSCFVLGSSGLLKDKLHDLDFFADPEQLHLVLLISAASVSLCVTETKAWLDAIYMLSKRQRFSSCTILLTDSTQLQNTNPVSRSIALRCIRALALVANAKLFPSSDGSACPQRTTVYSAASTDDTGPIARHLLAAIKGGAQAFDLMIDEDEAIVRIPPGMDSHTMICQSSSPDEALKVQMGAFKTNVQDGDDGPCDEEQIGSLSDYFGYVTAKTKAEDPVLSDLLANLSMAASKF